jgi:mevalonate kinase
MQEFHLDHIPACEIHIQTTLPIAAGLGSSASTAVSFTRALSTFLGHPLPDNTINRIAYEVEKHHHGSPSGIDNSVIAYETPVYYQKDRPIETLKIASPFTLVIADSGIKSSTAQAVAGVRQRWEQNRQQYEDWFYKIGQISIDVREYLENGMIEKVGPHLTHNHVLLQKIGVSNSELDNLVEAALTAGALGAKLSGGGLGGNMIALVSNEQTSTVVDALISHGAIHTITTTIPASGGIGHLR